jgi:hypothetical protein
MFLLLHITSLSDVVVPCTGFIFMWTCKKWAAGGSRVPIIQKIKSDKVSLGCSCCLGSL